MDTYERLAAAERDVERLRKEAQELVDSKVREAKRQAMELVEDANKRASKIYSERLDAERAKAEKDRASILATAGKRAREIEHGAGQKVEKGINALVGEMERVVNGGR